MEIFGSLSLAAVLLAQMSPVGAADPARPPSVAERLGHPKDARLLVLHADDLAMAHSVNEATFEALEQGWVTSASIMVPCPWFPEVAARAQKSDLDLGVHLTLTSEWTGYRWRPVSASQPVPTLLDASGYLPLTAPPVVRRASLADVEKELRAQIEQALAAGIAITHLDSHMGTLFQTPELSALYRRLGRAYDLPVLVTHEWADDAGVLIDRVLGISPGVSPEGWREAYEGLLSPLPPGVYELIVHLGYDGDELRAATGNAAGWGSAWRQSDLDLVRDPEFRGFLEREGFILVGWKELALALPGRSAAREP
jgi:predicted glycoside hydrolase/deacetylase ChbG (UPF0249 family)